MKKFLLIFFTATAVSLPVFSDKPQNNGEPLILTIEKAVELGLENNFNLKVQANKAAGAERNNNDAWNVLLPDVSLSATLSRSNSSTSGSGTYYLGANDAYGLSASSDDGIYDYMLFQSYDYEISPWTAVGNFSAQLALSPAMINGVKALELNYQNAILDMESAKLSTETSIKTNFYNLLLFQEQIEVLKKNIETTEARLESMEEMYNYGYVTELDVLNTKAGLSSLGPTLLQIENGYEQLKMVFLMDLGLDFNQEVTLEGAVEVSPELLDGNYLVNTYMADRIDIQQLTVTEEMLANAKSATANGRLPTLVLSWSYSPYQVDPFDSEYWGEEDYFDDSGSFSVTLSLPVEDWLPHSGTSNDIADAQNEISNMAHQKELALLAAEMEIRALVMTLNTSIESMKVRTESIEINQKSYDMSLEAYNSGQLSLLDLETAENELLQAELDLVSEKYNYISSLLNLEEAINQNLSN
ncbi:MAG: TolC family protein [Spirochaetales bacterium]|uniref:TolC family protein n=1 Tax=Candidatus Thalassospirochaeta sargassi TaxID=3119039 RepID=A0AAJ1IAL6_9SPIO|nr:TolC family protein [Spirochaetales bacterium]